MATGAQVVLKGAGEQVMLEAAEAVRVVLVRAEAALGEDSLGWASLVMGLVPAEEMVVLRVWECEEEVQ